MNFSILAADVRRHRVARIGCLVIVACLLGPPRCSFGEDAEQLSVVTTDAGCDLLLGDRVLASYITNDPQITRQFWCNLKTVTGRNITRPYPPVAPELDDHATMHPGVWMSFRDVSGNDYWRLKNRTRPAGFLDGPAVAQGVFRMTVRNEYLSADADSILMIETAEWAAKAVDNSWLLAVTSRFEPAGQEPIAFGDQEEMGLAVRVPRSISEQTSAGVVRDSEGRKTAADVWGHPAAWCDYGSTVDNRRFGVSIYPGAKNFRPCWWHVRDTGLMAANPFGRQALTRGEPSRIEVGPGQPLTLRFAIRVYDEPADAIAGPEDHVDEAMAILNGHRE